MTTVTRLRELFERLVELGPDERDALLSSGEIAPVDAERLRTLLELDERFDDREDGTSVRRYPWPGDRVGAYRLVAPIGLGGMGTIWRAESVAAPEVRVAVKFPNLLAIDRDEAVARLLQERAILAVVKHPGIVALIDAGETEGGTPYLILEELQGEALDRHAARVRPSAAEIARLGALTARALGACHELGVIHRDVKPSNVLVSPGGWPTLIDFGIATLAEGAAIERLVRTRGQTPMTPEFASPEQAAGRRLDASTDVYSLGKTLGVVAESASDAGSREAAVLGRVARAATAESERDRPGDMADLAGRLESVGVGPAGRGRKGRPIGLFALGAVCGGAALITLATAFPPDPAESPIGRLAMEMAEMPIEMMPGTAEDLLDAADRVDVMDLRAAAVIGHVRAGRGEEAMGLLGAYGDRWDELGVTNKIAFAEVLSRLGLPGPAFMMMSAVNPELLEAGDRAILELRMALEAPRLGARLDTRRIEALVDRGEVFGYEPEDEGLELALLAAGDPEEVAAWVEQDDETEPYDVGPSELAALMSLYAQLAASGLAGPLDAEEPREIDRVLREAMREDASIEFARPLYALRWARVVSLLVDDDIDGARDVAAAAIADEELPVGALDLAVRLRVGHALLGREALGPDERAELEESISAVFGEEAPMSEVLIEATSSSGSAAAAELVLDIARTPSIPASMRRSLVRLGEDAAERELWWWPKP
ncbi:MAG: serine/threonine-protein kinase [Planctomycetota bacterium]